MTLGEEEEKVQNRKRRIRKDKENLQAIIEIAGLAGEVLREETGERKKICGDLERLKETASQSLDALTIIEPRVDEINNDIWQPYKKITSKYLDLSGSITSFHQDIQARGAGSDKIATTPGVAVTSLTSGTISIVDLFSDFDPRIPEIKAQDTTVGNIEFIKKQTNKIEPSIATEIEKLFQDWSSSSPSDKSGRLLELRSLIFDRFLDRFAPESQYSKCKWFQSAGENTIRRKRRFAQVKFFIQGCEDDSVIESSLLKTIDSAAKEMFPNFSDMSTYGKHGAPPSVLETVFRETLSSFANVLRLRESLQG